MKRIEPELARLEASARFAGEHGAEWGATWEAMDQTLSKCCGSGAVREELQHWRLYEVALDALHAAWAGKPTRESEPSTWLCY